jgi:hypothetical protein
MRAQGGIVARVPAGHPGPRKKIASAFEDAEANSERNSHSPPISFVTVARIPSWRFAGQPEVFFRPWPAGAARPRLSHARSMLPARPGTMPRLSPPASLAGHLKSMIKTPEGKRDRVTFSSCRPRAAATTGSVLRTVDNRNDAVRVAASSAVSFSLSFRAQRSGVEKSPRGLYVVACTSPSRARNG